MQESVRIWLRSKGYIYLKKNKEILIATSNQGKIKEFTGISDPYEEPKDAEIVINSSDENPEVLVRKIYEKIVKMGFIEEDK